MRICEPHSAARAVAGQAQTSADRIVSLVERPCVCVCVCVCRRYVNIGPLIFPSEVNSFPSRESAQCNSSTTGRDQLNITAPTVGNYVFIAVYSKDVDSRYSILVTGEGRITGLTNGRPVTAQVEAGRSQYYVATVTNTLRPLTNYSLSFTLRSTSGDADLYISDTYLYPNGTHHNWTSQVAGDGLDMAVLRGDRGSELHVGNYFVAMHGNTAASFQLWSYLRVRQILQFNGVIATTVTGGVVHFELQAPRGAEFTVTAIPLAFYGGSFNLYVGNRAEPNPSVSNTYQVGNNSAIRVTPATSPCVGTESTCRYYVAVERVYNTSQSTTLPFYLFMSSPDVPPIPLLADVPLEKSDATSGGTAYQFNVTCPRSRVSITLVTSVAQLNSIKPMSVNRGPLPPLPMLNNIEFGAAQTVSMGQHTFMLSFDWTHPLLRGTSMVGQYMLTVRPTLLTGWTLLLHVDGGRCATLPAMTAMQHLMPYSAAANASSMAYFSYQTAANATGDLYFTLTPCNSSTSLAGLTILARADGDVPAAGYSEFSSGSAGVLRVSACACNNGPSSNLSVGICLYTVAVSSTTGAAVGFFLTASTGQPLYAMDARMPPAVLAGSVGRGSAASGTAVVPLGVSAASLVTEACVGTVSVFINYRTAAIPAASAADLSATSVTTPTFPVVPLSTSAATHVVASIVGAGVSSSTIETRLLATLSWSPLSPTAASTTLTVTDYRQVSAGRARVRIPLATVPAAVSGSSIPPPTSTTGLLRYAVYLLDKATASDYNLQSRCGLQVSPAVLVQTAYALTSSSNSIDVTLPMSSHRYTAVVLVDHVWRTAVSSRNYSYEASSPGYIVYTPVDVRSGTRQPDDDSSSSSGGMPVAPAEQTSSMSSSSVAVIVVIAVMVLLLVAMLSVWYYKRMVSSSGCDRRAGEQQLLDGYGNKHSSLPVDSFVQSHSQQAATQLTSEAYYAVPADRQ